MLFDENHKERFAHLSAFFCGTLTEQTIESPSHLFCRGKALIEIGSTFIAEPPTILTTNELHGHRKLDLLKNHQIYIKSQPS